MNSKVLKYSLYKEGDNPIFGESSIHIEIEDEAAGPYLKITNNGDFPNNEIILDFEELDAIIDLWSEIKNQWE